MKANRLFLALLFLLSLAGNCPATSYKRFTTSELIDACDAIVVGRFTSVTPAEQTVTVIETLKGRPPWRFKSKMPPDERLPDSQQAYVLLLRERHGRHEIFHPGCLLPDSTKTAVAMLLDLRRDPSPVLDLNKVPVTPDTVHTVGSVFKGFTAQSGPYRWLVFRDHIEDFWRWIPWEDKVAVSLEGTVDSSGHATVRIKSAPAGSQLAEFMKGYLERSANGPNGVIKPYWVKVDARIPTQVGHLSQMKALGYLRERLRSDDPRVVIEAIKALARMRDLESLEIVRPLSHEDEPVARYANEFVTAATRHANGLQFP